MFEEANKENFDGWTTQLIDEDLQKITFAPQFDWKNTLPNSNFDLLKRFQQCLNLTDQVVVSGLCYMKKVANRGLKVTERSVYNDFHYEIEDFSISSGITIKDILELETFTLNLLQYNLILSERDYFAVLLSIKL